MKKLKKWLVVELVKMNELLNGSLKFKELTIEKLRETRDTLESQNKAMQEEKEQLKEQLGLADFTVAKLKTKLSKFEDLKKESENISNALTVWIAMDAPIGSDERYIYIYNQQPVLGKNECCFQTHNAQYGDITELDLYIQLKPLECKKFKLIEVLE